MKARTLKEAMDWFLSHSSGTLVCVKSDGTEKECGSYLEAKEFFG